MIDALYLHSELPNETQEIQLTSLSFLYPETKLISSHKQLSSKELLITKEKPERLKKLFSSQTPLSTILDKLVHPSHTILIVDEETLMFALEQAPARRYLFWASEPLQQQKIKKALFKHDCKVAITTETLLPFFDDCNPQVIHPPYLPTTFPDRERHTSFIVGVVAPLEPAQGHETVLRALHSTREMLPQLRVILVGDGSEKRRLQWLIDHLHLRQCVQIISRQEHYERFITNFDVFVAPQEEARGWSPSLLHALSQGVPCITTKIGVHEDLLTHGSNTLFFEAGNSTVLAQHLLNLYNNPDWMQHYAQSGPKFIEQELSLEQLKKSLEALF